MHPSLSTYDIEFEKCTMGYDNHAILHAIDAHLPTGKISVILGGSGSGKSTLLRHVVGLSRPLSGSLRIGGTDFFALSSKNFRRIRRHMGLLFQDGALLGALNLLQNVALPLRENTSLSKKLVEDAALRALALVGLEDFAQLYPSQLSGGMRKRAGLARAIVTEPPLLLCDEPTSGLDPITAAQMDQLLLNMKKSFPHMTILVVSHDLASVAKIAEHVLVLHEGKAIFCGAYTDLKDSNDTYLRSFLQRKAVPLVSSIDKGKEAQNAQVRAALDAWMLQ